MLKIRNYNIWFLRDAGVRNGDDLKAIVNLWMVAKRNQVIRSCDVEFVVTSEFGMLTI